MTKSSYLFVNIALIVREMYAKTVLQNPKRAGFCIILTESTFEITHKEMSKYGKQVGCFG